MRKINSLLALLSGVVLLVTVVACKPKPVPVSGITLDKPSLTLTVGESATLVATVAPATASNPAFSWSSSNPAVATVADGVVKAVSKGSSTVTVTTEDGGFTATCLVSVDNIHVTGISVSPSDDAMVKIGEELHLSANVTPDNAFDRSVVWSSSNNAIATVSDNGLVKGVSSGTAVITATANDGGQKASVNVTVPGLSLSATETSVYAGYSVILTAELIPGSASASTLSAECDNTAVATVSIDENGGIAILGVAEGTATVTVTATETGLTATCQVTVLANNGGGQFGEDDYGDFN